MRTTALSKYLEDRGYILVEEVCPECGYGQLVKGPEDKPYSLGRTICTAYGQCELAPG